MRRDPHAYLWDISEAGRLIQAFTANKSQADYVNDQLLQSGVERQFMIIGEALSQLGKRFPTIASGIQDCPQIVAFRNVLIHEYHRVDPRVVWEAVAIDLPTLKADVDRLLAADPNPPL